MFGVDTAAIFFFILSSIASVAMRIDQDDKEKRAKRESLNKYYSDLANYHTKQKALESSKGSAQSASANASQSTLKSEELIRDATKREDVTTSLVRQKDLKARSSLFGNNYAARSFNDSPQAKKRLKQTGIVLIDPDFGGTPKFLQPFNFNDEKLNTNYFGEA